jgi:cytochrome c-type biogenesis protein CcmH
MNLRFFVLVIALIAAEGCDRRVEPYVPGETPQTPDLAKIFPEGADRAARPAAEMIPRSPRGAAPVGERVAPIEGTIELAPEFVGSVPPTAAVFLMVRSPSNGSLVAAKRISAPRFPLPFSIGSDDRMSASTPFASPLLITVRIDADGNATTREVGDLLGTSAETHGPGDRGVVVLVSEMQTVAFSGSTQPAGMSGDPHAAPMGALPVAPTGAQPAAPTGAEPAAAMGAQLAASTGTESAAATGTGSGPIEGTIELAPDLAGRVPPGAVLFVIARTAPVGPPLAVLRIPNPSFPHPFSIGPDDRMIQSMPFAGDIRITVRVDGDGNVMSRNSGDLQGGSDVPNAPGDRGVTLLIDTLL